MQEVTCFHCRSVVMISPDAERCSVCGEDLTHLLAPDYVSRYFYDRAGELAAAGRFETALREAERGLSFRSNAELHLLAAIVSERIERFDRMREHVASIPVDDTLRPEAEWLLRSHQERQWASRARSRQAQNSGPHRAGVLDDVLIQLYGSKPAAQRVRRYGFWSAVALVVLVALVGTGWLVLRQEGRAAPWMRDGEAVDAPSAGSGEPGVTNAEEPATEAESSGTAAEITIENDGGSPASTPSNDPGAVILAPTADPKQPDNSPPRAVVIPTQEFDLKNFLRERGYSELAALPIDARVQENRLILQGTVHWDIERRQLVELMEEVDGIREVSAVDLLLRPLPTYTVQEGDTLWTIVYNIYGDVERLDEFYAYNSDVLPSPDAISVGMELKVMPIE